MSSKDMDLAKLPFDWIDALLFALSFYLWIMIAMKLSIKLDEGRERMTFLFIFAPPLLRRKYFGMPRLGALKRGPEWVLVSSLGLLFCFASVPVWLVAGYSLQHISEAEEARRAPLYTTMALEVANSLPEASSAIPEGASGAALSRLTRAELMERKRLRRLRESAYEALYDYIGIATLLLLIGAALLRLRHHPLPRAHRLD